jgi:hypothetical protein
MNVRNFGMVEATALKLWRWGHLQWYDLCTEFHKIIPVGLKLVGGQTDRQTDRQDAGLISLHFPLRKESRTKTWTDDMYLIQDNSVTVSRSKAQQ